MPGLTTTLEAGYPDSDYTFWIGVFVPSQTPAEIVAKLHQELQIALQAAAVKEKLAALGVEPMPLTTAAFGAQVKEEISRYATFAKAAGLKPN
jgi:tripartite-type tricarboxylate transporter receptor subunit TctC